MVCKNILIEVVGLKKKFNVFFKGSISVLLGKGTEVKATGLWAIRHSLIIELSFILKFIFYV